MEDKKITFVCTPQYKKDVEKSNISRRKITEKLQMLNQKPTYKRGKKLKGNLGELRSVRMGDYRTIFKPAGTIYILGVMGNRNKIYKIAKRRKKKLREISRIVDKYNLKAL